MQGVLDLNQVSVNVMQCNFFKIVYQGLHVCTNAQQVLKIKVVLQTTWTTDRFLASVSVAIV